jgi:hypothetical protein
MAATKAERATQFMLVYIKKQNSWTVKMNENGKFKSIDQMCMVQDTESNKWHQGKIKFFGTHVECISRGEDKYDNGVFFESGRDDINDEDDNFSRQTKEIKKTKNKLASEKNKVKKLQKAYATELEDEIIEEEPLNSNQLAHEQERPTNLKTKEKQATHSQEYAQPVSSTRSPSRQATPPFTTQDWLQDDYTLDTQKDTHTNSYSHQLENLIISLTNKVDSLASDLATTRSDAAACKEILRKISSKKGYDKDWPVELLYKNENLLDIPQKKKSKYINAVMAILFTSNELLNGIIIDESMKKSKSTRSALEYERVKLLRQACEIKFRVADDLKAESWIETIKIANRYCYDSVKKDKTKKISENKKNKQNESVLSTSSGSSSSSTSSNSTASSVVSSKVSKKSSKTSKSR